MEENGYGQDPVAFSLSEISISVPTDSRRGQLPVIEAMHLVEPSPDNWATRKWCYEDGSLQMCITRVH